MTDPLSPMAEQLRILAGPYQNSAVSRICREAADAIEALLAAQSSWANEKAEMERQLADERQAGNRLAYELSQTADELAFWKFQAMFLRAHNTNRDIDRPKDWHAIEAEFLQAMAEENAERHGGSHPIVQVPADLATETIAALSENATLRRQLEEAAGWFREYEAHHRAKGDTVKAERNATRALACVSASSSPRGTENGALDVQPVSADRK